MSTAVGKPERKRVSITSKRQFTIPQMFYKELQFGDEAICTVSNGKLIIEPIDSVSGGEFAEQILSDLISEGYSGNELLSEFKCRQAKVRPAVEAMLTEAEDVANGKGEYLTYEDVFGTEN